MKSREERIEYLRRVVKVAHEDDSNKNYYTIKNWRGKSLSLKRIQIDVEYLMFRLENSRTDIQQLAYIRRKSLSEDYFGDPESANAQNSQEEILLEMVKSKGKDILEDLKLRGQEDPCIITYDGYIVNGNRRTSALKYLGERYIDCVVLKEDATPKDIYSLEQQLQIAQDFREDYHWINELRNIRRGKEDKRYSISEKDLASNLRLELKDLRTKLRILDLIDAFLLWKKIPKQYDYKKLDDAEEIFRQLEKAVKKYSRDLSKREALQNAIFVLIEERPAKGRLYGHVMDLIRNFDQIYIKVQEQANQSENKSEEGEENTESTSENLDLLDDLTEGDEENISILNDSENVSEISSDLVEIIADVKAENKEKKDTEAVYESVSLALRELQGLTIDNDTAKTASIKNKLGQIIVASNRLLSELESNDN